MKKPFRITINDKVVDTLIERGFAEESALSMKVFENTNAYVYSNWFDDGGNEYYTVDLCCEIPIECCKRLY